MTKSASIWKDKRFVWLWSGQTISSLVAGWIGNAYGVTTAMWIGAIGVLFSSAWVVFSPIRTMRELPSHA